MELADIRYSLRADDFRADTTLSRRESGPRFTFRTRIVRNRSWPPEAPDNYQVYADPAGHPFCLCWITR